MVTVCLLAASFQCEISELLAAQIRVQSERSRTERTEKQLELVADSNMQMLWCLERGTAEVKGSGGSSKLIRHNVYCCITGCISGDKGTLV